MSKKYLGIFYKNPLLWLHYVPLVLAIWGLLNILLRIFFPVNDWFILSKVSFNIVVPIVLYFVIAIVDQFVHALLDLVGVHD